MKTRQLTIQLTGNPATDVVRLKDALQQFQRENVRLGKALRETRGRISKLLRKTKDIDPDKRWPVGIKILIAWSAEHGQFVAAGEEMAFLGMGDTPEEAVIDLQDRVTIEAAIAAEAKLQVEAATEKKPEIAIVTPEQAAMLLNPKVHRLFH